MRQIIMPSLDWTIFKSLPESEAQNFENLCRGLMRNHFGRFGQFKALSNQPGVEFHIRLSESCQLGEPPRWFGWQCKYHTPTQNGELRADSRRNIEKSLRITEKVLPGITDWILWTPYTLSKKDQDWFDALQSHMNLQLWAEEDLDNYLSGDGSILRSLYFGELVLTTQNLEEQHNIAVQPIKDRLMPITHQTVDAERTIRRMLGEPGSWDQLIAVGNRLKEAKDVMSRGIDGSTPEFEKSIASFVSDCSAFADTLLRFHDILAQGDLDVIKQKIEERKTLIGKKVCSALRRFRIANLPIALYATNALDDMRIAQELLDEVEDLLGVGLVALLADAGGGKTHIAAQLTAPQVERPAGILLHGRALHRGQTLNDLSKSFSINGNPMTSMENLLSSLDAAAKRSCCRLPVIIDGLNEAENPKDWKPVLAELSEVVKKHPNVLVVCTLRTGEHRREGKIWRQRPQTNDRESFAVMALPESVRRIESEGFGGDVADAIKKYFAYFKINPGVAEIPFDFFQHPLNLKFFCEVKNPERKDEVVIDNFPASLSLLFEKYINNACERISLLTNLSHSYSANDVDLAIYKLGREMWKGKRHEIDEASFREAVSDTDAWDSSIVNLLAQEGIVFRNPGNEPDKCVITPAYDALGGYIIANSLLKKHIQFEWLNGQEARSAFTGDDSHELAYDIFLALVTLAPRRMGGRHIWKEAPFFRNMALSFTTELEAQYLDGDTVDAFKALLTDNPNEGSFQFRKLQSIRGAVNHPLNAEFIGSVLREMSVSERDLNWTEWVRAFRSEKLKDILALELRWKENIFARTQSDQLQAKWIMWFLTSTDRELRDVATRALYWYGRGDPLSLFEESIRSLNINDPYVPERMLAASYGVTMARHVDLNDDTFVTSVLPEYARSLYNSMFAKKAPFGTTHSLMREYAYCVIELASMHNQNLFSSYEMQRTKPPFDEGGIRKWGRNNSSKEIDSGANSPFQMDFENYTLGQLVPGRRNYDFKHEAYCKIRAQVLWRIEQLGWSSDLFGNVDKVIASGQRWSRMASGAKKTDRYGKKYSWIAFFEMSGLLHDQGILKNWEERTSTVDIDPSFPELVTKDHLIKTDFLGDPKIEMKRWIVTGPDPDVSPYLRLEKLQNKKGPWVALDGYFTQEDQTCGRSIFCFIRSFLVKKQDAASFLDHLSKQDMTGRWLPEKPETNFIFSGEIPWCRIYREYSLSDFSFVTKENIVKVKQPKPEFYLDGTKLDLTQADMMKRSMFGEYQMENKNITDISKEDFDRIEVREVFEEIDEVEQEFTKYKTLIPVCDFSWGTHQSAANDGGHATTLAKEVSSALDLIGQPQTFDMFTKDGIRATYGICDQSNDHNNMQSMFFIREELLKTYLDKNKLVLIWAVWGERGYSLDKALTNRSEPNYAVYSFVKRYE